uniref:Reverse transcriptase domain-containing protein n=1 Tax=Onchocerca flexuosa TaxID=387005 RepID=A0A183H8M8_9BILA
LLRRDVSFLNKYFSQKFLQSCGPDTVNELHKGLEQLQNWASISCFGYRTLIDTYKKHLLIIGDKNEEHLITKPSSAVPGYCRSKCCSIRDDYTEQNGIIHQINSIPAQQLPTVTAMNLIEKAFTPPRENSKIDDGYAGLDSCSVVSNATIVEREQCNLM